MFLRTKYLTTSEFLALTVRKDLFPVQTTKDGWHWRWYARIPDEKTEKDFWVRLMFTDDLDMNNQADPVTNEIVKKLQQFIYNNGYNSCRCYLANGEFSHSFSIQANSPENQEEFEEIPISIPSSEDEWKIWAEKSLNV